MSKDGELSQVTEVVAKKLDTAPMKLKGAYLKILWRVKRRNAGKI
jgi:hypothetical protein